MTRRTILVVEDNPITQKLVRAILTGEGYEVVDVDTGAKAIEEMRRRSFDLVLQDLVLSDMDGFQLLERLRETTTVDTPILAYTGLASQARILAAGFDALVLKPTDPDRLVEVVREHLVGRRRRRVRAPASRGEARATRPIPASSNPQDRAMQSMTAMLMRISELGPGDRSVNDTLANILASFLDVCGFSIGAAFLNSEANACPELSAHLGLSEASVAKLRDLAQSPGATTLDMPQRAQALFEEGGAASIVTVPLILDQQRAAIIVLGTANKQVPSHWNRLVSLVTAPIVQALVLARTAGRLAASDHKLRSISESVADGIMVTNVAGEIVYLNPAAEQILARSAASAVGRSIDTIFPERRGDMWWQGPTQRPDGSMVLLEVTVQSLAAHPDQEHQVYTVRDLSERARLSEYARLANQDPLTGLFNRRRFEEELTLRLSESRRHGTTGALLLIDLDTFKPINDTYGHQAGDAVLRAVGDVLRRHTRDIDATARLGGDEFVVLLGHTDAAGARACAAKLLDRISELAVDHEGRTLTVGASLGVAHFPEQGHTADAIFAAADAALYQSKRGGRNRVTVAPPPMSASDLTMPRRAPAPELRASGIVESVRQAIPARNRLRRHSRIG